DFPAPGSPPRRTLRSGRESVTACPFSPTPIGIGSQRLSRSASAAGQTREAAPPSGSRRTTTTSARKALAGSRWTRTSRTPRAAAMTSAAASRSATQLPRGTRRESRTPAGSRSMPTRAGTRTSNALILAVRTPRCHWRRTLARNRTRPRRRRTGATLMIRPIVPTTAIVPQIGPKWAEVSVPKLTAPPPRTISTRRPQRKRMTASMKASASPSSCLRIVGPDQMGQGGEGSLDDGLAGRRDEHRRDGHQDDEDDGDSELHRGRPCRYPADRAGVAGSSLAARKATPLRSPMLQGDATRPVTLSGAAGATPLGSPATLTLMTSAPPLASTTTCTAKIASPFSSTLAALESKSTTGSAGPAARNIMPLVSMGSFIGHLLWAHLVVARSQETTRGPDGNTA